MLSAAFPILGSVLPELHHILHLDHGDLRHAPRAADDAETHQGKVNGCLIRALLVPVAASHFLRVSYPPPVGVVITGLL